MILCTIGIILVFAAVAADNRPRGVSFERSSFYQPNKDFTCLESGQVMPFEYINDDYCDCADGTDEPGTSACKNGVFYCENRGHHGEYIFASRVSDGICDCCDGSDEYNRQSQCANSCEEKGRRVREEREMFRQMQLLGYKIKLEYIQQGKRVKDEKLAQLSESEKKIGGLVAHRDEMRRVREEAEDPEKEAKDGHGKAWEDYKTELRAELEKESAVSAFKKLDVNGDDIVDYVEMQTYLEFDIDSDGVVSIEECREYLNEQDAVDLVTFQEHIWLNIKDIFNAPVRSGTVSGDLTAKEAPHDQLAEAPPMKPDGETVVREQPDEKDDTEDDDDVNADDDDEDDDDDDDDGKDYYENGDDVDAERRDEAGPTTADTADQMPPYDEPTQRLIQVADAARSEYSAADDAVQGTEREISDLKTYLEVDHGPDEEFSVLGGQCFEFTDREYTFKLCPFQDAVQRPKSGGMETILGRWGHWYGPEEDRYDAMKYENGQNCWNGPNRICHVNLHCGSENRLTGASEPSRCEYQLEFSTPARCQETMRVRPAEERVHTEL